MSEMVWVPIDHDETVGKYSVEPHGNGYAIYISRSRARHGYNLGYISEASESLPQLVQSGLNMIDAAFEIKAARDNWNATKDKPAFDRLSSAIDAAIALLPSPPDKEG